MKNRLCFLMLCSYLPFCTATLSPSIENLPWIDGKDEEALFYAQPFLPEDPVILEAGVCNGEDSKRFKKLWPKSIVHGFEAHPRSFALAYQATKDLEGVFLYPQALFDRVGTITFYCSELKQEASSLLPDNKRNVENIFNDPPEWLSYLDSPITVPCTTIDHWVKEAKLDHIDYIWLDTEGAELYILRGADLVLSSVKVISVEINFQEFRKGMTMFPELYDFLTNHGFVLHSIWGNPRWQAVGMFIRPMTQ